MMRKLLLLITIGFFISDIYAATLTVTNVNDAGSGSLRFQISAATSGDIINFDSALNGSTITLTSGDITFSKNLTILGPGRSLLTISGNNNSRIFDITGGNVEIRGLQLMNCESNSANGGAVRYISSGNLSFYNVWFILNVATSQQGGAVYYSSAGGQFVADSCLFGANEASSYGAALSCNGTPASMDINYCVFDANTGFTKGTIFSNAGINNISNTSITNNVFTQTPGISFSGNGTKSIINCTFSGNRASSPYTLIEIGGGSLDIMNSTFSDNEEPLRLNGSGLVVNFQNNIFNNVGDNFVNSSATISSGGGNISNDATMSSFLTATNDMNNTDPMLGVSY